MMHGPPQLDLLGALRRKLFNQSNPLNQSIWLLFDAFFQHPSNDQLSEEYGRHTLATWAQSVGPSL